MADYADLAATAKELIESYGRDLILRDRVATPENPAKPWLGPGSAAETEVPVKGVLTNYDRSTETSEFVERATKVALIAAASTITDLEGFTVLVDGTRVWEIVKMRIIEPGDTRLLYKAYLAQ